MFSFDGVSSFFNFCYVDGGTGSMAFQVLIAGALTAGYVVRTQWSNLVGVLSRVARRNRGA
jgi:hypothetical protein